MADDPAAALALDGVRRLAKRDHVEVEHLLALANLGDASVIPVLRAFKAMYSWPQRGRIPGSAERFVPLGRWSDYVCAYLEGGCERIVALALDPEEQALEREDGLVIGGLALGVLTSVSAPEAVSGALRIGGRLLDSPPDSELSVRAALTAINTLLCLEPKVPLEPALAQEAREWVHSLWRRELEAETIAVAYCVLRAVGNESSIVTIRARSPLGDPWSGLEEEVTRVIHARLGLP